MTREGSPAASAHPEPTATASAPARASGRDLGITILKNTGAQGAGRLLIALSRLVVAGLVVRGAGQATFGQYALILGVLALSEWVVDFGVTDSFVRDISREPERRVPLLRVVTATKLLQVPAAYLVLSLLLLGLGYPAEIVRAALLGGLGMAFYGGVLVYRVQFRAALTMEREVASELLSIAVLLPLVALALRLQLGLVGLMLAYLASRAGFLAASLALGRSAFVPSLRGVEMASVTGGLRSSSVIGVIGLLVAAYETVDVLVLSRIDFEGVAFYSAAQRLIWPFVLVLSSIATALFPVLASHWPTARDRFETTLQHGIDASAALAGCAMCPLLAAPAFFMGIVGPQLASGAAVLEIMAVLGFAKAISSTLGPVLYVVHAQLGALRFIATALVAKTIGAMVLAPRFGFVGVAWGALCVEVVFAALPSVLLLQRASGYRVRWSVPLRVAVLGGVSAAAARMACGEASPLAALLALLLYAPGVFVLGGVRLDDVVALVQRRTS